MFATRLCGIQGYILQRTVVKDVYYRDKQIDASCAFSFSLYDVDVVTQFKGVRPIAYQAHCVLGPLRTTPIAYQAHCVPGPLCTRPTVCVPGPLCTRPTAYQAHCVPGSLCIRPTVYQAHWFPGPLCTRPIVYQAHCVPVPVLGLGLKVPIHFLTQSRDPISRYGKPVERTNELISRPISLVRSTGFSQQLL